MAAVVVVVPVTARFMDGVAAKCWSGAGGGAVCGTRRGPSIISLHPMMPDGGECAHAEDQHERGAQVTNCVGEERRNAQIRN